jgi:hypothetical protein
LAQNTKKEILPQTMIYGHKMYVPHYRM